MNLSPILTLDSAKVERDLTAMQAQSRGPTTLRLSNAATCQAAVDLDIMAE